MIKVLVPSSEVVPESVLIVIGDDPGAKVWDAPCFIVQVDSVLQPPEEDTEPPSGMASHPQLPSLPRWLGVFNSPRHQASMAHSNFPGGGAPDGAPAAHQEEVGGVMAGLHHAADVVGDPADVVMPEVVGGLAVPVPVEQSSEAQFPSAEVEMEAPQGQFADASLDSTLEGGIWS